MTRQDLKDLVTVLAECRKQKRTEAELKVTADLCSYLMKNHAGCLGRLLAMADYEVECTIKYTDNMIWLSDLKESNDPKYYARNEEEMRRVLWIAVTKGLRTFRVLVQPDFFTQLMKNDGEMMDNLCHDAIIGFRNWSYYPLVCLIQFRDCRPVERPSVYGGPSTFQPTKQTGDICRGQDMIQGAPQLKAIGDAIRYMETMASRLAGHISFRCSPELHNMLFHQGVHDKYGETLPMFEDLLSHAGVLRASVYGRDQISRFDAYYIEYYPGFALARMIQNNRLDLATKRQKLLLEAAKKLVTGIEKKDAAEKALIISCELGKRTTYVDDDTTDDDDCAFGPLITGQANCDGFADAFYLCATLAGLPVRFQHGDSRELTGSSKKRSHHMWNIVKINGEWVMLDATWDRPGRQDETEWIHCMIGKDRAEKLYLWNKGMTPEIAARTDPFRAPGIHEFYIMTKDDIHTAIQQVKKQKIDTFYLIAGKPNIISSFQDILQALQRNGIYGKIVYHENKKLSAWKVHLKS